MELLAVCHFAARVKI